MKSNTIVLEFVMVMLISTVLSAGIIYTGPAEYSAGDGSQTATIVIDFDYTQAFVFEYRWDGEATGWDALQAVDAAGDLNVLIATYSWGFMVTGFEYPGAVAYDYGQDFAGWHYYLSANGQDWQGSGGAVDMRNLTDGSWDSWVWTNYSPDWDAYRQPGQMPIPEPITAVLMGCGAAMRVRMRRT